MQKDNEKIGFFFRAPVFPILLRIRRKTWLAENVDDVAKIAAGHTFKDDEICPVIDYRWEGWSFEPRLKVLSPLAIKKRYTKKEFLEFCGVPDEQINNTSLDRYSRRYIFDNAVEYTKNEYAARNLPGNRYEVINRGLRTRPERITNEVCVRSIARIASKGKKREISRY